MSVTIPSHRRTCTGEFRENLHQFLGLTEASGTPPSANSQILNSTSWFLTYHVCKLILPDLFFIAQLNITARMGDP